MKTSEAFPSKYLKVGDLDNRGVTVTIQSYEMKDSFGKMKPEFTFIGKSKVLTMNRLCANAIEEVYGKEMDDWIGKQITLFATTHKHMGQTKPIIGASVPEPQGGGSKTYSGSGEPEATDDQNRDERALSESPGAFPAEDDDIGF